MGVKVLVLRTHLRYNTDMSNTYKGSIRDNIKYVTCNGVEIDCIYPEWGWYGSRTFRTAFKILEHEYGPNTAVQYASRFARDYLANMAEDGFSITSGQIDLFVKIADKKP